MSDLTPLLARAAAATRDIHFKPLPRGEKYSDDSLLFRQTLSELSTAFLGISQLLSPNYSGSSLLRIRVLTLHSELNCAAAAIFFPCLKKARRLLMHVFRFNDGKKEFCRKEGKDFIDWTYSLLREEHKFIDIDFFQHQKDGPEGLEKFQPPPEEVWRVIQAVRALGKPNAQSTIASIITSGHGLKLSHDQILSLWDWAFKQECFEVLAAILEIFWIPADKLEIAFDLAHRRGQLKILELPLLTTHFSRLTEGQIKILLGLAPKSEEKESPSQGSIEKFFSSRSNAPAVEVFVPFIGNQPSLPSDTIVNQLGKLIKDERWADVNEAIALYLGGEYDLDVLGQIYSLFPAEAKETTGHPIYNTALFVAVFIPQKSEQPS